MQGLGNEPETLGFTTKLVISTFYTFLVGQHATIERANNGYSPWQAVFKATLEELWQAPE